METSILGQEHVAELISSENSADLPEPSGGHNVDLGSAVETVLMVSSLAANFITIYLFLKLKTGEKPSAQKILSEAKGMEGVNLGDPETAEKVAEAISSHDWGYLAHYSRYG